MRTEYPKLCGRGVVAVEGVDEMDDAVFTVVAERRVNDLPRFVGRRQAPLSLSHTSISSVCEPETARSVPSGLIPPTEDPAAAVGSGISTWKIVLWDCRAECIASSAAGRGSRLSACAARRTDSSGSMSS